MTSDCLPHCMQVQSAIHELHVRPQHTFLVRNRTQRENESRLSLSTARELELRDLGHPELQRGAAAAGYGLGVAELGQRLVQLQERRITLDCALLRLIAIDCD